MKTATWQAILFIGVCVTLLGKSLSPGYAQDTQNFIQQNERGEYVVRWSAKNQTVLTSPDQGLWSVAFNWKDNAPADWVHIPAVKREQVRDSVVLSGEHHVDAGVLTCRDVYTFDGTTGLLKCVRRFEYHGDRPLEHVTLSVRWKVPASQKLSAFLPGILYYGNPSGERNTPRGVPCYHDENGEIAVFEEHRYPMPFACLENAGELYAVGIHTVPSPALRDNVPDQWWSMGVRAADDTHDATELVLYSGFVGFNRQNSVVKALQQGPMDYPESTIRILPGTVIEKTFYLDVWPITRRGTAFQHPIQVSLDLFQPYYSADLPTRESILKSKFEFAKSRWMETGDYAGFNMYPENITPQIVFGWCGQADSPGFALQPLEEFLVALYPEAQQKTTRDWIRNAVQKSLDFLSTSPITGDGFSIVYDTGQKTWQPGCDPVSMGQGMYNFAKAIQAARETVVMTQPVGKRFSAVPAKSTPIGF
ncbi:MAG: hypothetical protein IKW74_02195 [Thermoguttaceae bacterium]|nr:hypothetical protein [Thermoguttaceae bacterium]